MSLAPILGALIAVAGSLLWGPATPLGPWEKLWCDSRHIRHDKRQSPRITKPIGLNARRGNLEINYERHVGESSLIATCLIPVSIEDGTLLHNLPPPHSVARRRIAPTCHMQESRFYI